MDNLIKDNKCKRKAIRGTIRIEDVGAGVTKAATIKLQEELPADAVCVISSTTWPVESSVQMIGNNTQASDYTGYVIVSVTNQSETGVSYVDFNYLIL